MRDRTQRHGGREDGRSVRARGGQSVRGQGEAVLGSRCYVGDSSEREGKIGKSQQWTVDQDSEIQGQQETKQRRKTNRETIQDVVWYRQRGEAVGKSIRD